MTHDEMIAVIQAHKEGKNVEAKCRTIGSKWSHTPTPCWDFNTNDYRVVREPRRVWMKVAPNGFLFVSTKGPNAIEFVEVIQ